MMPVIRIGETCHEADCSRPLYKCGRCAAHYNLHRAFHKDDPDPLETLFKLPSAEGK